MTSMQPPFRYRLTIRVSSAPSLDVARQGCGKLARNNVSQGSVAATSYFLVFVNLHHAYLSVFVCRKYNNSAGFHICVGEEWKTVRTVLNPSFSTSKMKSMMQIMSSCTDEMLQVLDGPVTRGDVVDIYKVSQGLALDVITKCALAWQVNQILACRGTVCSNCCCESNAKSSLQVTRTMFRYLLYSFISYWSMTYLESFCTISICLLHYIACEDFAFRARWKVYAIFGRRRDELLPT